LRTICCLLVVGLSLTGWTSIPAFEVSIRTSDGDTTFFAPPGDTLAFRVDVDSEGEILTGVELFLSFDARFFGMVDTSPDSGNQPGATTGLLGDVLADTLFSFNDSLSVVHLAEASLSGVEANGTLFTLSVVLLERPPGITQIAIHSDTMAKRVSTYTVSNAAGLTFPVENTPPLLYRDLPPRLTPPDSLVVPEDGMLTVDLSEFGTDEEEPDQLLWEFEWDEEVLSLVQKEDRIEIVPREDYNGETSIEVKASDPSGGVSSAVVRLRVTPVNDSPEILVDTLPDTVRLDSGFVLIDLSASARDVDKGDELIWSAQVDGPVRAVVLEGPSLKVFAPVDWEGAEPLLLQVVDASGSGGAVSLVVFRTMALSAAPGDFDGDGDVDFSDFLRFVRHYNQDDAPAIYDLTGDGQVGFSDFLAFIQFYD